MSKKKGFALIETIVTVVVLATSLLYIYSRFNGILINEKTRVHYDDIAHMYQTYYIKEYFSKFNLNDVLKNLNEDNPMIIIGCDYSGISDNEYDATEKSVCNSLIDSLGINSIVVALGDELSFIQECNDNSLNKCSYLNNFTDESLAYFETLGDLGEKNKYVMIIEYSEAKILGEEDITNNANIHNNYNYAWVRI